MVLCEDSMASYKKRRTPISLLNEIGKSIKQECALNVVISETELDNTFIVSFSVIPDSDVETRKIIKMFAESRITWDFPNTRGGLAYFEIAGHQLITHKNMHTYIYVLKFSEYEYSIQFCKGDNQ